MFPKDLFDNLTDSVKWLFEWSSNKNNDFALAFSKIFDRFTCLRPIYLRGVRLPYQYASCFGKCVHGALYGAVEDGL